MCIRDRFGAETGLCNFNLEEEKKKKNLSNSKNKWYLTKNSSKTEYLVVGGMGRDLNL